MNTEYTDWEDECNYSKPWDEDEISEFQEDEWFDGWDLDEQEENNIEE